MAATTSPCWGGTGGKWVKGPHGWHEDTMQSEILADTIPRHQVKKIIELFLITKREELIKRLYTSLSVAPISKCSAKENVMWLQVSSHGSRECHGYSTLGELLRRLHMTGSVWQQGRFNFVLSLTELIIRKKFASLSGSSRRHLFDLIEALVLRAVETQERIYQTKKIVHDVHRILLKKNYTMLSYVGSRGSMSVELERVRKWSSKLNTISISANVDKGLSISDLPIEVQRHIVRMLSDHRDIESLSHVNKRFQLLCEDPLVWQNLCTSHFTKHEIAECESLLEKRRQKNIQQGKTGFPEISWRVKYHFMLKRYEKKVEEFADPLLLCHRCSIVFWQDSGHPCVAEEDEPVHEKITPKKLITLL